MIKKNHQEKMLVEKILDWKNFEVKKTHKNKFAEKIFC